MTIPDPTHTVAVTFERQTDQESNQWTVLTYTSADGEVVNETPAVVDLDAPTPRLDSGGFRYVQNGTVFLPPGLDRNDGDRFTFGGDLYYLVGRARAAQPHAVTGDTFWTEWTFQGGR